MARGRLVDCSDANVAAGHRREVRGAAESDGCHLRAAAEPAGPSREDAILELWIWVSTTRLFLQSLVRLSFPLWFRGGVLLCHLLLLRRTGRLERLLLLQLPFPLLLGRHLRLPLIRQSRHLELLGQLPRDLLLLLDRLEYVALQRVLGGEMAGRRQPLRLQFTRHPVLLRGHLLDDLQRHVLGDPVAIHHLELPPREVPHVVGLVAG
mmetsp:Transcript_7725/g.34042  ORF Transcript_7725/g.34042 Transcript_7725/m.34042 type:complete len:208 (-) Transcript_7725:318-941(-)